MPSPPKSQTAVHHAQFSVAFDFPVAFTSDVFATSNDTLVNIVNKLEDNKCHRAMLVIEAAVARYHTGLSEQFLDYASFHSTSLCAVNAPLIIAGGESVKDDFSVQDQIATFIEQFEIDRHSYIIVIGGGALLDAVGLAAATAHRGVRLIRIPTTVLAQNDAGIGVKNGINRFGQKNWYGTFAPPFAVINDDQFLQSLGPIARRAGMAEAVKVALIRDATFFHWIETNIDELVAFNTGTVRHLIERCAELHLQQITQGGDPFEQGTARPLDFGHWSAHRLEKMTYHRLSHGDAVAIGILIDCHYSHLEGLLDADSLKRIVQVINKLGFPDYDIALDERDDAGQRVVINGLDDFQRHLGGVLTITLLQSIGVGVEVHTMNKAHIESALCVMALANTDANAGERVGAGVQKARA